MMTKSCKHVEEALPQQEEEHEELRKLQEKCYLEQGKGANFRTTCALSCFDLNRDGSTDQGIPEETLLAAMKEVWIDEENPSFLNTVVVQVNSQDFIWGSLCRLTDDVKIRALALALYHEAENAPKYSVLLEVAKRVPIEFSYTGSDVSGWMLAQNRLQRKKKTRSTSKTQRLRQVTRPPPGPSAFVRVGFPWTRRGTDTGPRDACLRNII